MVVLLRSVLLASLTAVIGYVIASFSIHVNDYFHKNKIK